MTTMPQMNNQASQCANYLIFVVLVLRTEWKISPLFHYEYLLYIFFSSSIKHPKLLPTLSLSITTSSQNFFSFSIALSMCFITSIALYEPFPYPGKILRNSCSTYLHLAVTLGFSNNLFCSSSNTLSKCSNSQNSKQEFVSDSTIFYYI